MKSCVEICAGAGGQALGIEFAGFRTEALVEIERVACQTLRANRPWWNVVEADIRDFSGKGYTGVDLVSGGVPCPPFSIAGKQLGKNDERDLFPEALRLVKEIQPKAVLLENVRGLMNPAFDSYRMTLKKNFERMGYKFGIRLFNASDFKVSQSRSRVVIVAMKGEFFDYFSWPVPSLERPPNVGELLFDIMSSRGWKGAKQWRKIANDIAPTIVGGSKKHGGPDLGPTRAKHAWAMLGVDGNSIADDPPDRDFEGNPRLTVPMVARIQGFPDTWKIVGKKTPAYRQVGNAFPPPVAAAVAFEICRALDKRPKAEIQVV